MAFDWRDFLKTADHLRTLGNESSIRSGVSRAYYSVYGHCYTYAKNRSLITATEAKNKGGAMHSYFPQKLKADGDEILFEIGSRLDTLRARRIEADYLSHSVTFAKVKILEDTISSANEILDALERYKALTP